MHYIPGQNYQFRYTLAIALIVHGLVVFGISIGAARVSSPANQMEVTLSLSTSEKAPEDADFLAKTNQEGSGDSEEAKEITVSKEALFAEAEINDVNPLVLPENFSLPSVLEERRIITTIGDALYSISTHETVEQTSNDPGEETLERKTLSELSLEIASLEARLSEKQQPDSKKPRILILTSASTLATDNAEYIHQWRDRVESIGNLHYPSEAREKQLYGDVRLLVKVQSSGVVEEITIMSSSGHQILDRAAIESIRLASPFEPFPKPLADKYDRIDVIRTWQFRKNRVTSTSA